MKSHFLCLVNAVKQTIKLESEGKGQGKDTHPKQCMLFYSVVRKILFWCGNWQKLFCSLQNCTDLCPLSTCCEN